MGAADPVATDIATMINAPSMIANMRRNKGMAKLLEWFAISTRTARAALRSVEFLIKEPHLVRQLD
ncbi:hypothetical protein GCM10009764_55230 [Nocardia ninae]|uniref:Uncharacterized protein n=1 Tax=Nocardia ninae NBRC 108245 TaxID=1210091 RepID=A0A511M5D7_9NOCA|nr:hypothetical protein NN4_03440 [Nocardia ninae NBRC 108245]